MGVRGVAAVACAGVAVFGVAWGADSVPAPAVPINPGYHVPPMFDMRALREAVVRGRVAGTLQSLPSWSHGFSIAGTAYSYTLLGTDPAAGPATTVIPAILVPIKLTISDFKVNGRPLVLDAAPVMRAVVSSPIFQASKFDSGNLQFTDAMLHAEFRGVPANWHLLLSPSIAPEIDVTATTKQVQVMQAKSGRYLGIVNDGNVFGKPINTWLYKNFAPGAHPIFVSYNSLFSGAFGFHSGVLNKAHTALEVFTYTSWLDGVNDLFTLPSPNADTLAHEEAEVVHDAFGTSVTLEWGDWFNHNKCFQPTIEVGDAVEDAPAKVQNYHQKITVNGKQLVYTLQAEALLPWFLREYPSSAIHGAYSWPNETAILGPAPLTCAH